MKSEDAVARYVHKVASLGGKGRAKKLSRKRRKQIAKNAARTRWAKARASRVRQILTDGCAASGTPIDIKFSPGSYSPPREITVRVLKQEAAPYREIKVPVLKQAKAMMKEARSAKALLSTAKQLVYLHKLEREAEQLKLKIQKLQKGMKP
jgi:hypothetical protein